MAFIEANINVKLPDNIDAEAVLEQIRNILSSINDKDTDINAVEVDDPISVNPIYNQ